MSTVQEIQDAINNLPELQQLELIHWLHSRHGALSDEDEAAILAEAEVGERDSGRKGDFPRGSSEANPHVDFAVIVSPQARRQLAEIIAWIARDNPERADEFGQKLLDHTEILASFPAMDSVFRSSERFRKLVAASYLISSFIGSTIRIAACTSSRFVMVPATD